MKDYTQEQLIELIQKIVTNQNLATPVSQIKRELMIAFVTVSDEAIQAAIKVFNEDEMYVNKPIAYFKAIVFNKQKDIENNINKDKKKLGSIPKNIV